MLPVHDVLPSRNAPRATLAVAGLLGASWVMQAFLGPGNLDEWRRALAFSPESPTVPQAITTSLLSTGTVSAATGLLALWIYGDNVEDRLGPWRWLTLLIASTVFSAYGLSALAPDSAPPIVGAAGAIGGIIGAHLSLFPRMRVTTIVPSLRGLDSTDVPSPVIALTWLTMHTLLVATATSAPVFALGLPLVGGASGAVLVHVLAVRARVRVDWWSPSPSARRSDHFADRRRT